MSLLRGYLYVNLIEAENLPDTDTAFFNIDRKDKSDAFAQVKIGSCVIGKTAYINNELSPKWQESFRIPVCHFAEKVKIQVLDKDHVGATKLGEVVVRSLDLLDGQVLEGWYPLSGCEGRINLYIKYARKDTMDLTFDVPESYFTLREDCYVKLYQDADCPALPIFDGIHNVSGEPYVPACAWNDLYHAINNAQQFICITGWSVFTETILIRDGDAMGSGETVGQLLKKKAEEGVRVLIMVWNEKLSTEVTPGLMGTHDEDTRAYFAGSCVIVSSVPRMRLLEGITSFFRNQFAETCYTHHQKTIITDMPTTEGEDLPRVVAFLGGLDITNGRYDTPEHELYKTLTTKHCGDFYNGCAVTTATVGPRQPWHDIHCRLEGPVVADVLANFTERWRQQVTDGESQILPIVQTEFNFGPVALNNTEEGWNCQLFRSISSDSALFNFERLDSVPKRKGKYVDESIHRAYIHQIRRADCFLYIENQYFLGSAYSWDADVKTKAHHLIPQEIAQRIVEKMALGEHMCVYVVIPMFPEGDPTSGPVQEILHWQRRTMEMMYRAISKSIKDVGIDTHPTDYLSFYCLGKKESPDCIPCDLESPADVDSPAAKIRENTRFMIYVHSKMMIVDDDYIIIGSANINQRSMAGTRDSEIAIGAFQPQHTREVSGDPLGAIHQFRMALWAEHLGFLGEEHATAGTIECMRAVNEAAIQNWQCYSSSGEPCPMAGHLLKYPINVDQDGNVTALEDYPNFPDTLAPILGSADFKLPNKLTT